MNAVAHIYDQNVTHFQPDFSERVLSHTSKIFMTAHGTHVFSRRGYCHRHPFSCVSGHAENSMQATQSPSTVVKATDNTTMANVPETQSVYY